MKTFFTKIGPAGEPLPEDAPEWEANLDNRTGLMWPVDDIQVPNWHACADAAKTVTAAGFKDWYFPPVEELLTIVDRSRHSPAIDVRYFPNCKSKWYWAHTRHAPARQHLAWGVNFSYGDVFAYHHDFTGFLRAVRFGQ